MPWSPHRDSPATSNARNTDGEELITAYAVHRPDGLWSVLLINKDPKQSFQTNVFFRDPLSRSTGRFHGRVDTIQYSSKQYVLGGTAGNPYPVRAEEPDHRGIQSSLSRPPQFFLPPYSLTVIRGALGPFRLQ